MPITVLESRANATGAHDGGRVYGSIEAALEAFEALEPAGTIEDIETEKLSSDRVAITITWTEQA